MNYVPLFVRLPVLWIHYGFILSSKCKTHVFSLDEKSKDKINLRKIINDRSYLNKKTLNQVKLSQKKALIKTFVKENIPFREFKIGRIDEKVLGKLFAYFIIETIVLNHKSSYIRKLNYSEGHTLSFTVKINF